MPVAGQLVHVLKVIEVGSETPQGARDRIGDQHIRAATMIRANSRRLSYATSRPVVDDQYQPE